MSSGSQERNLYDVYGVDYGLKTEHISIFITPFVFLVYFFRCVGEGAVPSFFTKEGQTDKLMDGRT